MIFERGEKTRFPTPWSRRFALWPTRVGRRGDSTVYAWFSSYESRWLDGIHLERRSNRHGDQVLVLEFSPDYF